MKRYGHLFENIVKIENIEKAIDKASLHKKKRKSVTRVLNNKRHYAEIVQQLLLSGKYYPSPYLVSTIYDGARHKERTIYKPRFFPDQIIHWAVMLQIGDILLKRFYPYSCASIKGRGTKTAFKQTEKALKGNSKYCLKLDIRITLRRSNFLRVKRRAKKIHRKGYIPYIDACAMISYDGLIKKSNCYKYLTKYIYPYVSVNRCRKVVSNENRKQHPSNKKI